MHPDVRELVRGARDCASSFSWCGNRRSSPPPWMSKFDPRYFVDMAEHSMCQPGRPRPHGEGHEAVIGSVSLCAFHSAKSRASLFPRSSAPSDSSMSSSFWFVNAPYSLHEAASK